MKRNILTGLDIGSSKVCAAIAEVVDGGNLKVLGTGVSLSEAASRGVVADLDRLADAVAAALGEAEEKVGLKAHNIIANVGGPFVKGGPYDGAIPLSTIPREVSPGDIRRAIGVAKDLASSLSEDQLHLIPIGYTLDGQEGIENPLGLYGTKLKVKLYIITCATNLTRNIAKAINHAGYEAADIVYSGMALSHLLTDEEKKDGVAIIDMGSDVTELVVFYKGNIHFNIGMHMGGADLTKRISSQFKIPIRTAEELKKRYGTIHERDLRANEGIVVNFQQRELRIDRTSINNSINLAAKEVLSSLRKALGDSGFQDALPHGIVMCGAPLLMSGLIEAAEKEFSMPVKMAITRDIEGEGNIASNPLYTASICLLKYGLNKYAKLGKKGFGREGFVEKSVSRIKEIISEYF